MRKGHLAQRERPVLLLLRVELGAQLQRLDVVGDVVEVHGSRILLQKLDALHAYLVKLLMRHCSTATLPLLFFRLDPLLKPEDAVLLIGLVLLRHYDLLEGDRARIVQVEVRLVVVAEVGPAGCGRLLGDERLVVDHVESEGRETVAREDAAHLLFHAPDKRAEQFARRAVAEHYLLLRCHLHLAAAAAVARAEDEQAFVHPVEQLDALLVRKFQLGVQLGDVDDYHATEGGGDEEHQDGEDVEQDETDGDRAQVEQHRRHEDDVGEGETEGEDVPVRVAVESDEDEAELLPAHRHRLVLVDGVGDRVPQHPQQALQVQDVVREVAPLVAREAEDQVDHAQRHNHRRQVHLVLVKAAIVVEHALWPRLLVIALLSLDIVAGDVVIRGQLAERELDQSEQTVETEGEPGARLERPQQLPVSLRPIVLLPLREYFPRQRADCFAHFMPSLAEV